MNPPDAALLDKIDAAAKETRTLKAEFSQKNRMKLFRQELVQKGQVETLELLQRSWHVTDRSVRPDHRMVGHTGFITFGRRAPGAPPEDAEAGDEESTEDRSGDV